MSLIYAFTDTRWAAAGTTYTGIGLNISNGGSSGAQGAAGSRIINIQNNGTSVFAATLLGYLGLVESATSPTYALDITRNVNSGSEGAYPAIRVGNPGTTGISASKVQVEANNAATKAIWYSMIDSSVFIIGAPAAAGSFIGTQTADNFGFMTSGTLRGMFQASDGFLALYAGLRINVTPAVNTSAVTTITNGADSSSNLGHRISINLNGTTYWIPCGATAF